LIRFGANSAEFRDRDAARRVIDGVVEFWREVSGSASVDGYYPSTILVEGASDVLETAPGLDRVRAEAVVRSLVETGIPERAIWTRAVGASLPRAPQPASDDDRSQNRAVHILFPQAGRACEAHLRSQIFEWLQRNCMGGSSHRDCSAAQQVVLRRRGAANLQ
jgi:outer membrane protein OmpA-like peptidoglycan-associated protein